MNISVSDSTSPSPTISTSNKQPSFKPEKQEIKEEETQASDRIQISAEGFEKLRKINSSEASESSATEKTDDEEKDKLDKAIEQIQKQIKLVLQQLKELNTDDSEATQKIRQELLNELSQLNAALMGLIQKKLEALKEAEGSS